MPPILELSGRSSGVYFHRVQELKFTMWEIRRCAPQNIYVDKPVTGKVGKGLIGNTGKKAYEA